MTTSKKTPAITHPLPYIKSSEWTAPSGRILSAEDGTEFSVVGVRGRWRFLAHVEATDLDTEWVDAFGPVGVGDKRQAPSYRSFRVDRIKAVHTKKVARPSEA